MFSKFESLRQNTECKKLDRFAYLKKLVEEYSAVPTTSEMKCEVLKDLVKLCYSPFNDFLIDLHTIDIFLLLLADSDTVLVRFSVAGLCSLALDPESGEHMLRYGAVAALSHLLLSDDEETVLSSITTLMYLVTPKSKPDITCPQVIRLMLSCSSSHKFRIANLASIFLKVYCTEDQIEYVKSLVELNPSPSTPSTT